MITGPFPTAALIERLRGVTTLKLIGSAADLPAATQQAPRAAPAAYVVLRESGNEPREYSSVHVQSMRALIVVSLWLKNYATAATGAAAAADMDELEAAVRARVCGWSPNDNAFGPLWVSGNDDAFIAGWLNRQVAFRSDYRLQLEVQP